MRLGYLLAAILCCSTWVNAEDKRARFYENDYAMRVGQNERGQAHSESQTKSKLSSDSQRSDLPVNSEVKPEESALTASALQLDLSEQLQGAESEEPKEPGIPIKAIGIIVNAAETAHLEQVIKELLRISKQYQIPAGEVWMVGGTRDTQKMTSYLLALSLWGAEVAKRRSIPLEYEQFSLKHSPTWIIATDQGKILIEGRLSLGGLINGSGEFVEPKGEEKVQD